MGHPPLGNRESQLAEQIFDWREDMQLEPSYSEDQSGGCGNGNAGLLCSARNLLISLYGSLLLMSVHDLGISISAILRGILAGGNSAQRVVHDYRGIRLVLFALSWTVTIAVFALVEFLSRTATKRTASSLHFCGTMDILRGVLDTLYISRK